jgi:hypothetical protein
MDESPDRYERQLKAHLEVNPKSWQALQKRGVDEDTALKLDFEFTTPGEPETRELMRFLGTNTDYEYKGGARNEPDGRQQWLVIGTTSPMTLSPDKLDAWVTQMTHWGRDNGTASFDGWGAQTPESAPPEKQSLRKHLSLGRRGR